MRLLQTSSKNPLTVLHDTLRVGKTRVTLDTVLYAFLDGATPEEIATRYPSLHLADVYGAIALYLDHREEVDGYLRLRAQEDEHRRAANVARYDLVALRERLLKRNAGPKG